VPRAGLRWNKNSTFFRNARVFPIALQVGVSALVERFQERVRIYAQENAPWEDQTGEAREGLDTEVEIGALQWRLYLFHSVEYGIWLEIKNSGEYAIIMPTLETLGPELMGEITMAGVLSHGL
jgi:hypothetical protein